MKLIIGLGNPGKEYQGARHNAGFMVVDIIAKQSRAGFEFDKKINAGVVKAKLDSKPVILAKPQTFVNKSGEAVKKLKVRHKVKNEDIVIIHDDLDIEFGNFKLTFGKNSGGHRGVESVIRALRTKNFWRLKIGIGRPGADIEPVFDTPSRPDNIGGGGARRQGNLGTGTAITDFVLSKFTPSEQAVLKKVIKKAIERLEQIV